MLNIVAIIQLSINPSNPSRINKLCSVLGFDCHSLLLQILHLRICYYYLYLDLSFCCIHDCCSIFCFTQKPLD